MTEHIRGTNIILKNYSKFLINNKYIESLGRFMLLIIYPAYGQPYIRRKKNSDYSDSGFYLFFDTDYLLVRNGYNIPITTFCSNSLTVTRYLFNYFFYCNKVLV